MTQIERDPGTDVAFINLTGMPAEQISPGIRQVASALQQWITSAQLPAARRGIGGMFDRNSYVMPANPIEIMRQARKAVKEDDIVGGTADVTEGLIFQGAKWESEHDDDADIFNQISAEVNLDAFLRAAYRELFTFSSVVVASWWERRTYTVRGYSTAGPGTVPFTDPATGATVQVQPPPGLPPTAAAGITTPVAVLPAAAPRRGPKRRKKYDVLVPVELTLLDPTRVIPVGNRLWDTDRLAWHSTVEEINVWNGMYEGPGALDLTMAQLITGKYECQDELEEMELAALGLDVHRMLELNPQRVWRHTVTKPSYERWPEIRLQSVFRLLDLKSQLMEADRVNLIGAANYILLVRKGSKEEPAYQVEIDNLKDNFTVLAKLPVIVSDHRLTIDIITPKTDMTLDHAKYDVLDRRILGRLLGSLTIPGTGQRAETSVTVARMVARLLESRRLMLKRAVEKNIARAILDANPGVFTEEPNLAFTPAQLQLDNDPQVTQAVMALRAQKELSRDSILEFFGFDQAVEAQRRVMEADSGLDAIFGTAVPFNSPLNNAGGMPPGAFGPTGGRPTGGGTPDANPADVGDRS